MWHYEGYTGGGLIATIPIRDRVWS